MKIGEISCFKFPTQNLCRPSLVMRIYVYIFSIFLVHKFFQGCSNLFNYGPIDCGNVISISATQTVRIEEKKRTLSVIGPQLSMSKESNSTANESKRQYNRSIIYYLNIASIVNDSFFQKKKMKKKSGAAGTRTHGRGSVPLMSKLDAIPLRHEAETFVMALISC